MKRLGSLRFDGALAPAQRDAVAGTLSSAGVEVASWTEAASGTRSYAALRLPAEAAVDLPGARFDVPSLQALEVEPRDPARLAALVAALAGPGRPACVVDALSGAGCLLLELAPGAPLRPILDTIDVELASSPGRTIRPLLPLGDEALAALAAATLGIADLDAGRLIERYSEPLLAGEAR